MADKYTLIIRDKTMKLVGFDRPEADVIRRCGKTIAVKVSGYKYWSQLPPNSQSYAPAEYEVYEVETVIMDKGSYQELRAFRLISFPVTIRKGG